MYMFSVDIIGWQQAGQNELIRKENLQEVMGEL